MSAYIREGRFIKFAYGVTGACRTCWPVALSCATPTPGFRGLTSLVTNHLGFNWGPCLLLRLYVLDDCHPEQLTKRQYLRRQVLLLSRLEDTLLPLSQRRRQLVRVHLVEGFMWAEGARYSKVPLKWEERPAEVSPAGCWGASDISYDGRMHSAVAATCVNARSPSNGCSK